MQVSVYYNFRFDLNGGSYWTRDGNRCHWRVEDMISEKGLWSKPVIVKFDRSSIAIEESK